MPSLLNLLSQKLELLRLENRYTKRRHRRSTFVSDAIYVDGEYIYANGANTLPVNNTGSSSSTASYANSSRNSNSTSPSSPVPNARFGNEDGEVFEGRGGGGAVAGKRGSLFDGDTVPATVPATGRGLGMAGRAAPSKRHSMMDFRSVSVREVDEEAEVDERRVTVSREGQMDGSWSRRVGQRWNSGRVREKHQMEGKRLSVVGVREVEVPVWEGGR